MEMNSSSLKNTARFAGLLYLVWIITGLYGMLYVPSQIDTRGDAATAAQNILSREFLFRTSIITDVVSGALWVIMALVLYRLFKSVNDRQAKLMVALVIVQVPTIVIIESFNIAALKILKGETLKSFELVQRQELASLFLRMSDYGVMTLEMFWGLWLFPLAILVYVSRFLPRFLGVWLFINGLAYLALSCIGLLLPQYKDTAFTIAFPTLFGELALMLWLLIRGARVPTAIGVPGR